VEYLPKLLQSLKALNYPKNLFEILLINDCSEDTSEEIILQFKEENPNLKIQLLQNKPNSISPKKDALTLAISKSKNDYLAVTDADGEVPKNWLHSFNQIILQEKSDFIAGPVIYKSEATFLNRFQTLDFLSLQAATLSGFGNQKPFLCNGANLCYKKKSFYEVNGFDGNLQIASGDDVFLMQKMQQQSLNITYQTNSQASVLTIPPKSWKLLLRQRIRWAAKTTAYKNNASQLTAMIVFSTNLFLTILFFGSLFNLLPWKAFFVLFFIKFNLDFIVLFKTAKFYREEKMLKSYGLSAFIHPPFIVLCAFFSFFKQYEWKGRGFKK
jgi:cellulose synthase/poly-beta-1,6-N-acetylglucosamine synthase-like glycosyltransferase